MILKLEGNHEPLKLHPSTASVYQKNTPGLVGQEHKRGGIEIVQRKQATQRPCCPKLRFPEIGEVIIVK